MQALVIRKCAISKLRHMNAYDISNLIVTVLITNIMQIRQ